MFHFFFYLLWVSTQNCNQITPSDFCKILYKTVTTKSLSLFVSLLKCYCAIALPYTYGIVSDQIVPSGNAAKAPRLRLF